MLPRLCFWSFLTTGAKFVLLQILETSPLLEASQRWQRVTLQGQQPTEWATLDTAHQVPRTPVVQVLLRFLTQSSSCAGLLLLLPSALLMHFGSGVNQDDRFTLLGRGHPSRTKRKDSNFVKNILGENHELFSQDFGKYQEVISCRRRRDRKVHLELHTWSYHPGQSDLFVTQSLSKDSVASRGEWQCKHWGPQHFPWVCHFFNC